MDWRNNKCSIREKLLYSLTHENCKQDVVIVVGSGDDESEMTAHSFILSVASLKFEQLIETEGKLNKDGMTRINIPDVTRDAMNLVLKYMYTDSVDFQLCDKIHDILNAALKFNLPDLSERCVEKLKEEITSENYKSSLVKSNLNTVDFEQLHDTIGLRNANYVLQFPQFLTVTNDRLCKLLISDDLNIDEISLFKALISWGKAECQRSELEANGENLRFVLKKMIPLVRYTLMTIEDFATVVTPTNVLHPEEMNDVFQYLSFKNAENRTPSPPKWIFSSTPRTQNVNTHSVKMEMQERIFVESRIVNKGNAHKEKLLKYFKSISGSKIISGLCFSSKITLEAIETITTMNPGIISMNMPSFADGGPQWQSFVDECISFWKSGSLLHIVWANSQHPLYSVNVFGTVTAGMTADSMWSDLMKDGGHLNKAWKKQLDCIAPFLLQLQTAGVVPSFDILPHLNLKYSWWRGLGGVNGTRRLYRMTHDYLLNHHRLNSFIWTWSLHCTGDMLKLEEYWPGDAYVDVASVYIDGATELPIVAYQNLLNIIQDKPISLENNYYVPTPQILAQYPQCTWFTARDDLLMHASYNNDANLKLTFQHLTVLNRGAIEFFKTKSSNIL